VVNKQGGRTKVKIALILFDGVTFLDFVGFYDVVTRFRMFDRTKDLTWNICGIQSEVTDELGMKVAINKVKPNHLNMTWYLFLEEWALERYGSTKILFHG
jgi:hypothetical protein